MSGNKAMEVILTSLRNRSTVVLPNSKTPTADETAPDFDYQIEYLESQMRGADFERYMTRLDEEISLALFTPILLMRTADVGSYNLGTQHSIIYQWMLNAIGGDWKFYLDWYILRPLRDYNFGTNASLPKIHFRKMGAQNEEMVRDIVRALFAKGAVKADMAQLGEIAGLELTEVKQLTSDPEQPGDPTQPSQSPDDDPASGDDDKENRSGVFAVVAAMRERLNDQVVNAFRRDKLREAQFDYGYQSRFESALVESGIAPAQAVMATSIFYRDMGTAVRDMQNMTWSSPEEFMKNFDGAINYKLNLILDGSKS